MSYVKYFFFAYETTLDAEFLFHSRAERKDRQSAFSIHRAVSYTPDNSELSYELWIESKFIDEILASDNEMEEIVEIVKI